jgi:hypothetical protein
MNIQKSKRCLICGKEFYKKYNESAKDWETRHKYCSRNCSGKSIYKKGLYKYQFKLGDKALNPIKKGEHLSAKTQFKKGNKPWNYKDGKSKERKKLRTTNESYKWKREVLRRDNFICWKCGQKGHKLVAHHINNFSEYEELRYDLLNGATLCWDCHAKIHSLYGYKTTIRHFKKFLHGTA